MSQTTVKTKRKTTAKTYIDVAYTDRDLAKRLGARWDASVKRWYCPSGSTLALIYKWRKSPTPAELAAPASVSVPTPLEEAIMQARPAPKPAAAPAAKVVKARISRMPPKRMPPKRMPAQASNDLFANLELPLAG